MEDSIKSSVYSILATHSWFVEINDIEGNFIEFEIIFDGIELNKVMKREDIERQEVSTLLRKADGFLEKVVILGSDRLGLHHIESADYHKMMFLFAQEFLSALEEAYRQREQDLEDEKSFS
jgi:hypothetical protein